MNVTVIVWLGVGLVIFVLSFLLPKRKEELDEDTKKFAGEQRDPEQRNSRDAVKTG